MKKLIKVLIISLLFIPYQIFAKTNVKIYISPFDYKSDDKSYEYFKKSLPRSIRSTIKREMSINMGDEDLSRDELVEKGYNYYIKGMYKITKTETFVTFTLMYAKADRAVLLAFAHGTKGGTAIFDMIDGISKLVVQILQKPAQEVLNKTRILSIDKQGNIKQSTESLAGLDLSGGNFTGADLSARDLTGADLSDTNLTRVNFTNAILVNVNFSNAILDRTIFSSANIKGANFEGVSKISIYNNFHSTKNMDNAKFDPYAKNIISTPSIYVGVYLGPGYSYNQHQLMSGGQVYTRFTGNFSARLIFKTGYYFGVFADVGYMAIRALEKDPSYSAYTVGYDLHYTYFSFGPAILVKNVMFYTGMSLNFLLYGTKFQGDKEDSARDLYNTFNVGFVIGGRVKYYSYSNFDLTVGFDMKFQIDDLSNNLAGDQKIFALYLSLGILFSI